MSGHQVQSFRARYVWVEPGRCYAPGELRVAAGRVVGVGPARGGRVPARAILPALVNAHVHLQIPPLGRAVRSFLPWVGAVMAARSAAGPGVHGDRARAALAALVDEGVAAVGEIDSTGDSPAVLGELPVGGVCYRELTGFHLGPAAAADLVRRRATPGTRYCRAGWSPHAPYSVSPALLRSARRSGRPLAIHVAETLEELRFLRDGDGPFRDLLERLGRLPAGFVPPGVGPVRWLDRQRVLGPGTAVIHAQHIDSDDVGILVRRRAPVVVCPGTIRYFRRSAPPVPAWLRAGLSVGLGTDSVASNARLSMRHEMALACRLWPELAPETILALATSHGGRALGRVGLGTLRRGAAASFVVLPMARSAADCLEAFTHDALAPQQVWLRGRRRR